LTDKKLRNTKERKTQSICDDFLKNMKLFGFNRQQNIEKQISQTSETLLTLRIKNQNMGVEECMR
jgi:hypothetical protein